MNLMDQQSMVVDLNEQVIIESLFKSLISWAKTTEDKSIIVKKTDLPKRTPSPCRLLASGACKVVTAV